MAKRIVEGLWDCPYCQTKAIGGLTKHCPRCGHPQDAGTKFYMGNKINYLDSDLAAQYGQGPDWLCPYCGSLNRTRFEYCSNCGAPKEAYGDDYFTNRQKQEAQEAQKAQSDASRQTESRAASPGDLPPKRGGGGRLKLFGVIALALVAVLLFVFWPRTYSAEVRTCAWAREIDVEAWRTVQESDWSVPDGGRVYDQRSELHHYAQVIDHYETRTRTVSESVYDGEDYHTSYSDNGDGTFTEETYSTPRYRTEYHTETYQEPVYRDEPVFYTKYYYEIERWVTDRELRTSGADSEPYWAEYELAENERVGFVGEVYTMAVRIKDKNYTVRLPQEWWETFASGDKIEATVVAGNITKINGQEIE